MSVGQIETIERGAKWKRLGWSMGLSAEAIAGLRTDFPRDPADLVRCVKYCESKGYSTAALRSRMAGRSVAWDRLLAEWDNLVDLLKHEVETRSDGMAPRTYSEMQRVVADGIACTACEATGRGIDCAKCKGTGRRCGGQCRADRCFRGADLCPACRGLGYRENGPPA